MKICYYPGCTLKATAQNLEDAGLAALAVLGIAVEELPRWNCCGAVFSLATDDVLHQIAPTRILIRAQEAGAGQLVTLCAQCYNTLARANLLARTDAEKRETLNRFMTEEPDYRGEVEVVHYLQLLRDQLGWNGLAARVRRPLAGLKVAPYYGCTLLRPAEVNIDAGRAGGPPAILRDFLAALGATPVDFPLATECCSAYQVIGSPAASLARAQTVVAAAVAAGADALVLSCPLCDHNLGRQQLSFPATNGGPPRLPVLYFSQLLALALGIDAAGCGLDRNVPGTRALLAERNLVPVAV
ncbi:MAG: heterodisulfide reductase-related iron-sulfur binding cluster [Planctomycetota bacterium]